MLKIRRESRHTSGGTDENLDPARSHVAPRLEISLMSPTSSLAGENPAAEGGPQNAIVISDDGSGGGGIYAPLAIRD